MREFMMFEGDLEENNMNMTNKRKKVISNCKNDKRRFSDEQIRCLEMMFESETKLEPRKKVEIARELGLQPRQVAIWFQNKRARWKSKHIEKEYDVLLANYNTLAAQFESLKKDKHSLLNQLQKLKSELGGRSSDGESSRSDHQLVKINDFEVKNEVGMVSAVLSDDDDSNINADHDHDHELCGFNCNDDSHEILKMVEGADWGTTTLHSDDNIGHEWWDFWS